MKTEPKPRKPWVTIALIIIGLTLLSMLLAGAVGLFIDTPQFGNVAVISVIGPISVERTGGWQDGGTSSRDAVALIRDAEEDPSIEAVLIDINSPGGSAVASDEIGRAIKNLSKPTVAVIREVGASGGYWIASAADHVITNRMSITGSIGVISSYLEFADLITRYNVTYRRLVAGKYKDMGSPFKELSTEEAALFQDALDSLRAEFISTVAENRRLPRAQVEELATGQFFIGTQALAYGLVDELGGEPEAIAYLESQLNTTVELVPFEPEASFLDLLAGMFNRPSFAIGEGIGSAVLEKNSGLPELR